MSEADLGYGLTLEIKATADAAGFTELAEVYSFTPPEVSIDQVDVTHFKSPNRRREFIPALSDNGTASAEMNYVPGSATDLLIEGLIGSGDVVDAQATYANGTVVTFTCSVSGYSKGIPVDDRMTATLELKVTGEITVTPAPVVP
ncbi:phage tail tube protein [Paracoccus alkanivorans]|uniref:Phage tail protein n=1 Tax=Paracoccus alkanivorans TaxID=2116655 RepID=A0A3M0MIC4_9RHOB|nr:phage tail tube protein [Paracoccus alkanivorans]RMC37496.1 phage tail protein [Paracoccus alkanivorans]